MTPFEACHVHMRGHFTWGTNDCMTSSVAAFRACHPQVTAPPPCQYASAISAMRILREFDYEYTAWARSYFSRWGLVRTDVANVGDLVMAHCDDAVPILSHVMGLMVTDELVAIKTEYGFTMRLRDTLSEVHAWRFS